MNTHTEISDGGPAFPFVMDDDKKEHLTVEWGMSLRDYFAGMALQAILRWESLTCHEGETYRQAEARVAYESADAMIAARNSKSSLTKQP